MMNKVQDQNKYMKRTHYLHILAYTIFTFSAVFSFFHPLRAFQNSGMEVAWSILYLISAAGCLHAQIKQTWKGMYIGLLGMSTVFLIYGLAVILNRDALGMNSLSTGITLLGVSVVFYVKRRDSHTLNVLGQRAKEL